MTSKTTSPQAKNKGYLIASVAMYLGLLGVLVLVILMNLTPPISRDALIHHLAIPKLWLKHGWFHEIPWAKYSYYPMNIDVIYALCLYLKNDIAPKFVHFAFGLATSIMIYAHLRKRLGHHWGVLGGLIFLSTPIVIRLSTSAYIDLGLTFFTTAAVLAFLHWRDRQYRELRWFVLSAVSMGLAAGCKYNAMIPWAFLNLAMIYCFAKDTEKQGAALGYGVLFFVVALLLVSPWYLKNYLMSSNPIYPLLDGVFNPSRASGNGTGGGAGFFQRREVMYGESLWETLLIPLRMFFQGRDGSAQYFDGALNPMLVLFVPFAFLRKNMRRDTFFFLALTLFVLITSFFLASPRVRYILPVVPLLAIITATGVKALLDRSTRCRTPIRHGLRVVTLGTLAFFVFTNGAYLKTRLEALKPFDYLRGRETKDQFLARHVGSYRATQYINDHVPADATVFLMFMAGRGYYLDRDYYHDASFGRKTVKTFILAAMKSEQDFLAQVRSFHFSHVLLRKDLFQKYLADNFDQEDIARFFRYIRKYWRSLHESNGHVVFEIHGKAV